MEVVKDAMARERASGEPGLNPTAASLLGFLDRGEMTGWDLVQLASTFIGDFWSLTQSQIYRELDTLERGGLVTGGAPGKRQRRPFALTGAGRGAFQEWLRQDPGPEHHRMPFLIKVSFAAQGDPAALALLLT
ncbi:MAG TPA: PadR family transcriptional regulator, partial [Candidatus Dormibacteraeota bacterium]|nr:PadR family transcriptional regulator [Candidatus Dormibacteraeota bacterium]